MVTVAADQNASISKSILLCCKFFTVFLPVIYNNRMGRPTIRVGTTIHEQGFSVLQFALDRDEEDWFFTLSAGVHWEGVTKGRQGAVLLEGMPDGSAPVVRSTTKYTRPHQCFREAHAALAAAISAHRPGVRFNNALIERFTWQYRSMGAHSDQAMDLQDGSCICLFTCYSHPGVDMRQLVVTDKCTGREEVIPLEHGSVVCFTVEDNARFLTPAVMRFCLPSVARLAMHSQYVAASSDETRIPCSTVSFNSAMSEDEIWP